MKRSGWLYTLLGLLAGIALGRQLTQHRQSKSTSARQTTTTLPNGSRKLTREDLLQMIEENGGPEGLQLVGENLSGIDLSFRAVREELRRRRIRHTGHISWYSAETHGFNLREIVLRDANLSGANFFYAVALADVSPPGGAWFNGPD